MLSHSYSNVFVVRECWHMFMVIKKNVLAPSRLWIISHAVFFIFRNFKESCHQFHYSISWENVLSCTFCYIPQSIFYEGGALDFALLSKTCKLSFRGFLPSTMACWKLLMWHYNLNAQVVSCIFSCRTMKNFY